MLHGGPGAPGSMAPVARGLAGSFRVLEPFQRGASVAEHVAGLGIFIREHCPGEPPALVGSSWGAMLALAFAAAHPERSGRLVLVGCGTFDKQARSRMRAILEERAAAGLPLYKYDPAAEPEPGPLHEHDHRETWEDMLRLQEEGMYPAAFRAIRGPVMMLHGTYDPHPGRMILDGLKPVLPQIEYREWERCGHYPWLEPAARDEFFAVLGAWLTPRATT